MSGPSTLQPFQPATMSTAQLTAVSYLARDSGRTHTLYTYQPREWFAWCVGNGGFGWLGGCLGPVRWVLGRRSGTVGPVDDLLGGRRRHGLSGCSG